MGLEGRDADALFKVAEMLMPLSRSNQKKFVAAKPILPV